MTEQRQNDLSAADDAALADFMADAQLPALLVALAHVTGDESLLCDELVPDGAFVAGPQGGYDEAQIDLARRLCREALSRFRDAGCPPPETPDSETLRRLLSFFVGAENLGAYFPLLLEELALGGADARAPGWTRAQLAPDSDFRVVVIGAGMSGLVAALRLKQAGVPFVVLEKNDEVGGTWYENKYPGCRVDVPNHFYSYSFAQKADWPQLFSTQDVLLDYFRNCADDLGLREHIRFETEVKEARFDEERAMWTLGIEGADGSRETLEANALISAVGQLNRPIFPDIKGIDDFEGPAFHSASWDASVELAGKRVAVVGTGASAAQLIPCVAQEAAHLTVFQRTAPWILPTPDNHEEVPAGLVWLLRHVPYYARWYRFWLFWTMSEGLLDAAAVDEAWPQSESSVSAANDLVREMLTAELRAQCGDDDALFEKMLPTYPPFAKRFVRDNGLLPATYRSDNVELVTEGIECITKSGIRTKDGREIAADVIIYGTGFSASRFLAPMKIVGRGGRDLHEHWNGDARAYLGITVPHFPNLFMLYGPNTNIVVNGSIIYFSECEVNYTLECLRALLSGGHRAMDCREEAHDDYNRRIDDANQRRAWGAANVNTWYKNETGRVSQNWPSSLLEYWQQTREVNPSDYELL